METHQCLRDVGSLEIATVQVQQKCKQLVAQVSSLPAFAPVFEAVHGFPVAYSAFLCELQRRIIFSRVFAAQRRTWHHFKPTRSLEIFLRKWKPTIGASWMRKDLDVNILPKNFRLLEVCPFLKNLLQGKLMETLSTISLTTIPNRPSRLSKVQRREGTRDAFNPHV